jgi:hypothetical protein
MTSAASDVLVIVTDSGIGVSDACVSICCTKRGSDVTTTPLLAL